MSQILLYQSEDGRTKLDVRLENQTLWLNQKQLTELFGKAKGTISEHIKHIFEDGELEEISVVRLFRTTATDGKIYEVSRYNLDMVLALGFRMRSPMAVRFRQWAADKLKGYITKGFVLDDGRLKNPQEGNDYFEELTRRIQDIRTSERRFYQKITDIYATSIDYDNVTLQAKGYETKTFQPQTTMNPVSVLNLFNILFWGVDAASGALWKYDPNFYDVKLDRSGSR